MAPNHPNRSRRVTPAATPSPADIRAARDRAGLTQTGAATLVHSTLRRWQDWEAGTHRMHPGLWELFAIKAKRWVRMGRPGARLGLKVPAQLRGEGQSLTDILRDDRE